MRKSSARQYLDSNVNFWKSAVHRGLSTAAGDPSSLTLYQHNEVDHHRTFVSNLRAEYPTPTEGRGRKLDEWRTRVGRPDNHYFDACVYAFTAASVLGVSYQFEQRPLPAEEVEIIIEYED